jgi:hypothetical protein
MQKVLHYPSLNFIAALNPSHAICEPVRDISTGINTAFLLALDSKGAIRTAEHMSLQNL